MSVCENNVNLEIYARVLFLRNSKDARFCENKILKNGEISLLFTDVAKPCPHRDIYMANMSFNSFRESKILAKISEFTVNGKCIRCSDL